MTPSQPTAGAFRSGLPYNRLGHGPRPLVVVQGLVFENKPQPGLATRMYHFLGDDYTMFSVARKPRLPAGYTLRDMANDYAAMIWEEFGDSVDVIGISTGAEVSVQEITVLPGAACVSQRIGQAGWPRDSVISSVRRGRRTLVPYGDTVLQAGDVLMVVAEGEAAVDGGCTVKGAVCAASPLAATFPAIEYRG